MVRTLARHSRSKIPMAKPNERDMPPNRTKKVRFGIHQTQIRLSKHDIVAGAVIGDGDRKRAPFLVLGLSL